MSPGSARVPSVRRQHARRTLPAASGALGVVAFVGGWVIAGLHRRGYSFVHQAISQLARRGTADRAAMTAAFVCFGIGMLAFGLGVAREWRRGALGLAVAITGAATIGVAAFPLSGPGGRPEDGRHAAFATLAYATLALSPLIGRHAVGAPKLSVVMAVSTALALALSTGSGWTGLWQRLGLSVGDAWLLLLAARLYARPRPGGRVRRRRSIW